MTVSLETAFRDLFKTPEKWITLLLLTVCILIPIVGPIVLSGYLIRRFASVRKGFPETDFKFELFGEYLQIGLWPFLCSLIVSLCAVPFILLCYAPLLLIALDPESGAMVAAGIVLTIVCFIACSLLLALVMYPVMLRAGLMMQFGAGFSKDFIVDFIRRCGWHILLWTALLVVISIPAYLIGYLALFVGIYPVAAILYFVGYHLMFQVYDLYLERGGQAVQVADYVYSSVPLPPPALPPTADPRQDGESMTE